jgi:hypothetical protein
MQLRDALMALRIEATPNPPVVPLAVDYLNDETVPSGPTEPQGKTALLGGPPKRRNRLLALVAAGAAVLAAVLLVGFAWAARGAATTTYVFKTPLSASPSPSRSRPDDGVACGPGAPASARCIAEDECYDSAKKPIACDGRHTWEAFAFATLPDGVRPAEAAQNSQVRQVCSRFTLVLVDPSTVTGSWRIDVLTPKGSSRVYRCLAGKGPNALSGPQLRKTR